MAARRALAVCASNFSRFSVIIFFRLFAVYAALRLFFFTLLFLAVTFFAGAVFGPMSPRSCRTLV